MDDAPPSPLASPTEPGPATAWLDGFFEAYHRDRPVNATFIGVHEHDQRLPDCSEAGLADLFADTRERLAAAETVTADSDVEALDLRLAQGFLRQQEWELEGNHFQNGNPSWYTGEAVFGVISLLLTDFAPAAQRLDSAVRRLEAIPGFLQQARARVRDAPAEWLARASRECDGALALLSDGIDWWCAEHPRRAEGLRRAADLAAVAFESHRVHLEADLRSGSNGNGNGNARGGVGGGGLRNRGAGTGLGAGVAEQGYAAGSEALDLYIREAHFLDRSADEIAEYAQHVLDEAQAHLEAHAADFHSASPAEALAGLREIRPERGEYLSAYQRTWDHARAAAEDHHLLTWPDFPIRYVPRPQWVRSAAPHLYFLFYRSPAAVGRPDVHDYLVTPIDDDLPDNEASELLAANNYSVISLNHVIHHGSIGHHVQNWHAFRAESRVGRIAAVDCASRVAMSCGGTMAEGWACYATDLMDEVGFLTPLESYAEVQSRARMACRAIVDVRLHQGRFSLDDAIRFYQERAAMPEASARGEAVKNSMFPGMALMYLMGTDTIRDLRADVSRARGADFNLRDFHDRFLSFGSIPVALIADAMRSEAGA